MSQKKFRFWRNRAAFAVFLLSLSVPSIQADTPNLLNPGQSSTTASAEDKALQTRVLAIIETLSVFLHKIGVRIGSLQLSPEITAKVKEELADMQENLKALKARHSIHAERTQLVRLIISLNAIIKALEVSLKKSFQVLPEPDPKDLKRSVHDFPMQELEELLRANEKRLRGFNRLINDMNKSVVNRTYSWFSDRWNTPLFSITSLGGNGNRDTGLGDSNKDIYVSSILKRMFTYSAALGIIVYNVPKNYIDSISNTWLRNWVLRLKGFVGEAPYQQRRDTQEQAHEVSFVTPSGKWHLGEIGEGDSHILRTGHTGLPLVTHRDGTAVDFFLENGSCRIQEKKAPTKKGLLEQFQNYLQGTQQPPQDNNSYIAHLEGGSQAIITDPQSLKFEFFGKVFQLPSGGFAREAAPGVLIDPVTKLQIVPSQETLANAQEMQQFAVKGKFGAVLPEGIVRVSKRLIINPHEDSLPTTIVNSRPSDYIPPVGIINRICSYFSWIAPLELSSISFQIPVAAYIAQEVYKDIATVKKDLPQVVSYLHSRLRGEEEEVVGSYSVPKETFADVVGREELKNQLRPIINFVSNPASYIQAGIKVPRGYLLAGEPQTGKTLMVKALAGELSKTIRETQGTNKDVKVFPIEVHYLIRNGIKFYMDILRDYAPCILFCDEFDLTGAQRSENKVFLAEALTALSGYATSSDLQELVLFVIATNRPENIDYAIRADGRCGTTLYFENPYFEDRKNYFKHFFKSRIIDPNVFDLEGLAQETEACSYGTLQTIAHGILSTADKYNEIPCQRHAEEVLDTVVRKVIYETTEMPEEKCKVLAARYGAQAFASVILNPTKKFVAATIMKITEKIEEKPVLHHYNIVNDKDITGVRFGGVFSYNRSDTYGLISNEERLKECKIALAGTVGQRILDIDYTSYPEDEMKALKIARRIVFDGCDERVFPRKIREQKGVEAYLLVERCRREMYDLLEANKENFEKLVDLLQRRKVIRTSDIKQCFGLDDLNLIKDYFSPIEHQTSSEPQQDKDLLDEKSEDELDAIEQEEEELAAEEQQKEKDALEYYQNRQKELAMQQDS